jgi:hypothetical protein
MSAPDATPTAAAPDSPDAPDVHPVVRTALRISLSAKEYRALYSLVGKRAPGVQRKFISPSQYDAIAHSKNRRNEAAVRASLRVFVGTGAALKLVETIISRIRKTTEQSVYFQQMHFSKIFFLGSFLLIFLDVIQEESPHPATPLSQLPPFSVPVPRASTPSSALPFSRSNPGQLVYR